MSFKQWKPGKLLQSKQGVAMLGLLVCVLAGSCFLPLLIELKAAVPSLSFFSSVSCSSYSASAVSDPSILHSSDVLSSSASASASASDSDSDDSSGDGSFFACSEVIIDPEHSREELKRTSEYFVKRIPQLERSLTGREFYAKTVLLDESTKTSAYVYAVDENYADRLNGFFYYLIDETVSVSSLSPVVLTVSILFDEPEREVRIADGSFADPCILEALEESLSALLGGLYDDRVLEFIYRNYCRIFSERVKGEASSFCYYKLELPGLDVYFRNAFMTYIEFYVK